MAKKFVAVRKKREKTRPQLIAGVVVLALCLLVALYFLFLRKSPAPPPPPPPARPQSALGHYVETPKRVKQELDTLSQERMSQFNEAMDSMKRDDADNPSR